MSHLTKSLIGAVAASSLALVGCGSTGNMHTSSSSSESSQSISFDNPTQGMSQENSQRFQSWTQDNINHSWWDSKVVFHPEANVYFDPYTQLYYFQNEQSTWTESQSLPTHFSLLRSTRQVVERREILTVSGISENVMAFNPEFELFTEELDDVLRTADGQLDYSDYDNK